MMTEEEKFFLLGDKSGIFTYEQCCFLWPYVRRCLDAANRLESQEAALMEQLAQCAKRHNKRRAKPTGKISDAVE